MTSPTLKLNTTDGYNFVGDSTPTLEYTGSDSENDDVEYNIQIDTSITFDSQGSSIADSYSDYSATNRLNSSGLLRYGQSFTSPADASVLDKVEFFINKTGSPTGTFHAKIYIHSGTYGTSSVGIGTALATSDDYDISTVSTTASVHTFNFSGAEKIMLEESTYYVVVLESDGQALDSTNYVSFYMDTTSPTHDGNYVYGNWSSNSANDSYFAVYSTLPLIDKNSVDDVGFANVITPSDTHPFTEGEICDYDVQAGDSLANNTYYWRVRAIDPGGNNYYGDWSVTKSFTTSSQTPTVALNTADDSNFVDDTTPTFEYTGTDLESDAVEYNIQIDTELSFDSTTKTTQDSYNESNFTSSFYMANSVNHAVGQSFTASASSDLTSCELYIRSVGSPTGNIYAKLYSHSGTYGSSSVGGTLLATSDPIDATTVTDEEHLEKFTFSGDQQYSLNSSTYYVIVLEYTRGDGDNKIAVGFDSSGAHSGNTLSYSGSTWSAYSAFDSVFYVYSGTSLLSKDSAIPDAGFANVDTPANTHPFISGDKCDYDVQTGDALSYSTTYYWRVSAIDPSGGNIYGGWSDIRSFIITAQAVPTVVLSSPADTDLINDTTPRFEFTGSDGNGDDIEYNIQIDSANTFDTGAPGAEFDYVSTGDAGFENIDDGADTHPFTEGDLAGYTPQSELNLQTYYWRVRAIDPLGGNTYGDWATTRSFEIGEITLDTTAFRFYEDGTEDGSTALEAQNTDYLCDLEGGNALLGLRFRLQNTSADGYNTDDFQLIYSKNGSAYVSVTDITSTIKGYASSNLTDGGATTNRLGAGTGSFVAGEVSEDGEVDDNLITANDYTELLYSLTIVAADLSNDDVIDFKVIYNGGEITNTEIPRLTAEKALLYKQSRLSGTVKSTGYYKNLKLFSDE